jgi:hypothetical protein
VKERRKGKTRTHARSPCLAGPGVVRHGAHDVRVNSPLKSGLKPHRPAASFCHLVCYESMSNTFDRDRPTRLWDAVTLGKSSLYIRAAATEIGIYQQPQNH